MLHAFAYSSQMSAGLSDEKIRDIVSQSASFNRVAGVTGALLISGQQFFQYLEGPPDGLTTVMHRIYESRSHHTLVQVLDAAIEMRAVPYWAMTRVETGQTVVSGLVNAQWDEFGHRATVASPGMELLVSLLRPHFPALGGAAA
ncbi:BLUF domain-containing protein [Stenotrophomonas sp.]|uniref:BLUF domain-containing protein n=1 Tax=Stenotrophomonas sp. TaxID=69392 RepID=UPI0028AFAC35|nr:BLUF domain-containing protein [Stenotrophomonas sp.]